MSRKSLTSPALPTPPAVAALADAKSTPAQVRYRAVAIGAHPP
jgi:hypothetical protein